MSKTGLFQIKLNLHVRHKTSFPVKLEPVVYRLHGSDLLAFQVHVVQKILPAKTYSDAKPLRSTQILVQRLGRFPFNKNSGVKFWKFHVPSGTVHSGCTDQTQATTHLVIVVVSRMYWRQQFSQMEKDISSGPTGMIGCFEVVHLQSWSQILRSDRTKMVHYIGFLTKISGILG